MIGLLLIAALGATPDGGFADAPLTVLDANGNLGAFVEEQAGKTFVCEPEPMAITLAQRLVSLTTERDELKTKVLSEDPGWLRIFIFSLGAALAAAAATFGILDATGHFR